MALPTAPRSPPKHHCHHQQSYPPLKLSRRRKSLDDDYVPKISDDSIHIRYDNVVHIRHKFA